MSHKPALPTLLGKAPSEGFRNSGVEHEVVLGERPVLRTGHGRRHLAGALRAKTLVKAGCEGIRQQLDDAAAAHARLVERMQHERASDSVAVRRRIDPDVLEAPAIA